jgi:long-chain acyl-CoA synthetase
VGENRVEEAMVGLTHDRREAAAPDGTIGGLWQTACGQNRGRPAFHAQVEGSWRSIGWVDAAGCVDALAAGFLALGIKRGDRVALLSRTRVEWSLCDLALASLGVILVPVYPTASASDVGFVIEHCDVGWLIVETARQLRRLGELDAVAGLEVIVIDGGGDRTLEAVRELGRVALDSEPQLLSEARRHVGPQDVLTYLYTSGTTGQPKACILTHHNFVAMVDAVCAIDVARPDDTLLLFLPLAHNFARLMQYVALRVGIPIAYCRDFWGVPVALVTIRPTLLPSVPWFYERVYSQVQAEFREARGVRRWVIAWALGVGRRAARRRQRGSKPGALLGFQLVVAERLVFRAVKARLGGALRLGVSGGAALPTHIAELFDALGIMILEGYGLSEATCASHFNRPDSHRLGTVGLPLPGVEVRLAEDGEILLRGDTIFAGYLADLAATAAVMTDDGWLRTGDVGELYGDGFLRIVDRKKDLIVTSGGKNIAPQKLEALLGAEPVVSHALVVGDGRPYLVALIAPDLAEVDRLGLSHEQLEQRIDAAVKRLNQEVGKAERIARHAILQREFSQADGEVTATLKLRRRTCAERYTTEIERLYDNRLSSA